MDNADLPYVFHALHAWIAKSTDAFDLAQTTLDRKEELFSALVEGTIASLLHRGWESYYIKAEGEVDVALISGKGFFPVEVKCSSTLRRGEFKQILKYKRGIIAYLGQECGAYEHLGVVPIPLLAFVAESSVANRSGGSA